MGLKDMKLVKGLRSNRKLRFGGVATLLTCALLVVVIGFNVAVSALEANWNLKLDLTRNRMYSVSEQSVNLVKQLAQDVHIYTLYKEGSQNQTVMEMLDRYRQYSDHIKITNIDPIMNPRWAEKYRTSDETISQGSVIVTSADDKKFRVISSYSFYEYDYDEQTMEATGYKSYQGEMKVTNAIVYVTAENTPTLYYLEGHAEMDRYNFVQLQDSIEAENFAVSTLNLMTGGSQLKAKDIIVVAEPKADLTDDEREVLKTALNNGVRMVYMMSGETPVLANFESVLSLYGITPNHDVIVENDTNHYVMSPIYTVPNLETHDITSPLRSANTPAVMINCTSFTLPDLPKNNNTVEKLLSTTNSAVGKMNPKSTRTDFEEGDIKGPMTVGLAITHQNFTDDAKSTKLAIYGASDFMNLGIPGGTDLYVNTLRWMQDKRDTVSIGQKSMATSQLRFYTYTPIIVWSLVVAIGIPLSVMIAGLIVALKRRNL